MCEPPCRAPDSQVDTTKPLGCARPRVSIIKSGFLPPERNPQPTAAASWDNSLTRCSRINLCVNHRAARPTLELILQPSAAASWRGSLARCSRINLCVTHCAERPSLELLLPNRQVAHGRASRYLSRGFFHPRGVYNHRQQHRGAVL